MEKLGVIQTLKKKKLEEDNLGIVGPKKLVSSSTATPFIFLGGDAFALKSYLTKLSPQRGLTVEKRFATADTAEVVGYLKTCLGSFLTDDACLEH